MAQATSTIELGSAIAYAFGRTPLVLAAEARDLDELSGGRLTLGLGTGTRRMQQDWHGLDGEHPASRMEELVPLLRQLWRLHEGPDRARRPLLPAARPADRAAARAAARRTSRSTWRASTPRMVEAAGAVADGLVGHPLFTPEYVREVVRPALARGAERAGREAPPIAGYLTCSVGEDRDAARQRRRRDHRLQLDRQDLPRHPSRQRLRAARPTRSATPGAAATSRAWPPRSPTR